MNTIVSIIFVFPNPVLIILNINSPVQIAIKYTIYDSLGQILKSANLDTNKKITISDLSNGLYFVSLPTETLQQTIKFIKK